MTAFTTVSEVQRYIQLCLQRPDNSQLRTISGDNAQVVLDEVWKVLDSLALPIASTDVQFLEYRTKLRELSLKLAITHNILPSTLILQGVECSGPNQIAAGAFADIFVGTFRGSRVALKRLRSYLMATEDEKTTMKRLFYRESILWKNLVHDHILPFIGVAEEVFPGTVCMVIPWMDNGSLKSYIEAQRRSGKLHQENFVAAVNEWLYQIASGLAYLHDEGIVHGDLHGGNILVDDTCKARLADFGMALVSESSPYGFASIHGGGATRWKAPELIDPEELGFENSRPTKQSDTFSFACTCVELFSGKPPMHGVSENQVARRYVNGQRPSRPVTQDGAPMTEPTWSVVTSCWTHKPSKRPSSRIFLDAMTNIQQAEPKGSKLTISTAAKKPRPPLHILTDIDSMPSTVLTQQNEGPTQNTVPSHLLGCHEPQMRVDVGIHNALTSGVEKRQISRRITHYQLLEEIQKFLGQDTCMLAYRDAAGDLIGLWRDEDLWRWLDNPLEEKTLYPLSFESLVDQYGNMVFRAESNCRDY